MADTFTETSHRGLGTNLMDSIKSLLVGILMFLVSFPVLWWNEGRLDISTVAKKAIPVNAESVDAKGEGKLVAVTGPLTSSETIGDPKFLKPGPWVSLEREAEMFAWVEEKKSETKKNVGGSSDTKTTYTYKKKWTSRPQDSSEFKLPEEHKNPPLSMEGATFTVSNAKVGAYGFDPADAQLPSPKTLPLDADMVKDGIEPAYKLVGNYLYHGHHTIEDPAIGDVRVSFTAVKAGQKVTLFGQQSGNKIEPYLYKGEDKLYRAVAGTREEAIALMHGEYTMMTWILRLVGFLLMWIGMSMFFAPINAVLDVLPFLGSTGRALVGIVLFPVALVLTLVTMVISMVAHSPIALVLTFVIIAGGIGFYIISRKKKTAAAAR